MRPRAPTSRWRGPDGRVERALLIVALLGVVTLLLATGPPRTPGTAQAGPSGRVPGLRPLETGPALQPMANGLGAQGHLIVSPTDPRVVPNDGIRTNITAFDYVPIGPDDSFQVAVEEVIGGYDAVFGIFDNYARGPVPFFDVFTNQSVHSVHLAYGTQPVSGGTAYEFDLRASGGTVWTLRMNGAPLGGTMNTSSFVKAFSGSIRYFGLNAIAISLPL